MFNQLFQGLFDSSTTSTLPVIEFLICVGASIIIGAFLATVYTYKNKYTQSFVTTLALIPTVVCVVIMMVNGNLGAGVAVTGAFSLVRFRSVPGSAKEIGAIFIAMGAGLITGMGYLGYAVLFVIVLSIITFVYSKFDLWKNSKTMIDKTLIMTIPEDLDYTDVFEDLMKKYTDQYELVHVKTTNMGSLFKLTYHIQLKDALTEKHFIDELRCRNGNLEIVMTNQETQSYGL